MKPVTYEEAKVSALTIANMLNALENPHILNMLSDEELKAILQAVKNYIVLESKRVLKRQE